MCRMVVMADSRRVSTAHLIRASRRWSAALPIYGGTLGSHEKVRLREYA